MGKKKAGVLGRSIIRDRFGGRGRIASSGPDFHLHTSELEDGYDWNRINLRSVTEETSLDEFLATAELAGTEFTAEKLNIKFVGSDLENGLPSKEEEDRIKQVQDEHRALLSIPRRPAWDENTTAAELDTKERESFLEWRRQLAELQAVEGLVLTPFERNLDFWRQLWRVIERSDVIVQIVDARDPLLFRCRDLEAYVKEVDPNKLNMLLVNKADYLTAEQREAWAKYFDGVGVNVAFWSATEETERNKEHMIEEEDEEEEESDEDEEDEESEDYEDDEESDDNKGSDDEVEDDDDEYETEEEEEVKEDDGEDSAGGANAAPSPSQSATCSVGASCSRVPKENEPVLSCDKATSMDKSPASSAKQSSAAESSPDSCADCDKGIPRETDSRSHKPDDLNTKGSSPAAGASAASSAGDSIRKTSDIMTGDELVELFKSLPRGTTKQEGVITIGLVGYPNVGKSSTINALLQTKKVPVSATPGRTKHFQTLFLEPELMLCDCPGLVMPSYVSTKAHMVIAGILPIDQMRDYVPPSQLVCRMIPRDVLQATYGILLPLPQEGEDPDRPPTAHELLSAHGFMRGYMTHKGIPDFRRSARFILKDFVTGKLLYSQPPPGISEEEFRSVAPPTKPIKLRAEDAPLGPGHLIRKAHGGFSNEVDQTFFTKVEPKIGVKGIQPAGQYAGRSAGLSAANSATGSQQSLNGKPWKKHKQKGKKEKLRRKHKDLEAW